jgi:hypothetical protein
MFIFDCPFVVQNKHCGEHDNIGYTIDRINKRHGTTKGQSKKNTAENLTT